VASRAGANASLHVLTELLSGIQHRDGADDMTFSLDKIETFKHGVSTKLILPSGDVYQLTVEWIDAESP
jgi:hypothetical protein